MSARGVSLLAKACRLHLGRALMCAKKPPCNSLSKKQNDQITCRFALTSSEGDFGVSPQQPAKFRKPKKAKPKLMRRLYET